VPSRHAAVSAARAAGAGKCDARPQSLFGQFLTISPCPTWRGEGRWSPARATAAAARVESKGEKTIQIDVPAGGADQHYLTLRGQGVPGPRNGPQRRSDRGADIKEDPRFETPRR